MKHPWKLPNSPKYKHPSSLVHLDTMPCWGNDVSLTCQSAGQPCLCEYWRLRRERDLAYATLLGYPFHLPLIPSNVAYIIKLPLSSNTIKRMIFNEYPREPSNVKILPALTKLACDDFSSSRSTANRRPNSMSSNLWIAVPAYVKGSQVSWCKEETSSPMTYLLHFTDNLDALIVFTKEFTAEKLEYADLSIGEAHSDKLTTILRECYWRWHWFVL